MIPGYVIDYMHGAGFEPGRAIAPILHCNWNCPFKKRPRGQFAPSTFREKTRKEGHTKRFISVQKLQAETERGSIFYRTFKVHPKVTFQSRSTAIC